MKIRVIKHFAMLLFTYIYLEFKDEPKLFVVRSSGFFSESNKQKYKNMKFRKVLCNP